MATKTQAQIGLQDNWIEDPELLDLLEKRQEAKEKKGAAVKTFNEKDMAAKEKIKQFNLSEPRRCGRFILQMQAIEGGHVEFDTAASMRPWISVAEVE